MEPWDFCGYMMKMSIKPQLILSQVMYWYL